MPHPIDLHVGARVRFARTLRNLSQDVLGEAAGVSFQQIQKYERGTNRISASVLFAFAERLELPVDWFFEGLEPLEANGANPLAIQALIATREGAEMALRMATLPPKLRRQMLALMRDFADPEPFDLAV